MEERFQEPSRHSGIIFRNLYVSKKNWKLVKDLKDTCGPCELINFCRNQAPHKNFFSQLLPGTEYEFQEILREDIKKDFLQTSECSSPRRTRVRKSEPPEPL